MLNATKKGQKQTKGRQKIEIKPIQQKSNLQVTFSKRRAGLIKKAGELSLLCGADVAVVAFSPGNKVFSFGHPDVDTVIDRYLAENYGSRKLLDTLAVGNHPQVNQWNREYEEAMKELEEEKMRLKMIKECNKESENDANAGFWWDITIDNMGLEELEEYVKAMQELRKNVAIRANGLMADTQSGNQNMDAGLGGIGPGDDIGFSKLDPAFVNYSIRY